MLNNSGYSPLRGSITTEVNFLLVTFCTFRLFFGANPKSAQLPLYVWLPDGPTTISALIIDATKAAVEVFFS